MYLSGGGAQWQCVDGGVDIMTRISLQRLRTLLDGKYYRQGIGVVATFGGGWFRKVAK